MKHVWPMLSRLAPVLGAFAISWFSSIDEVHKLLRLGAGVELEEQPSEGGLSLASNAGELEGHVMFVLSAPGGTVPDLKVSLRSGGPVRTQPAWTTPVTHGTFKSAMNLLPLESNAQYFVWIAGRELDLFDRGEPIRLVDWKIWLKDAKPGEAPDSKATAGTRRILKYIYIALTVGALLWTCVLSWKKDSQAEAVAQSPLSRLILTVQGDHADETRQLRLLLSRTLLEATPIEEALVTAGAQTLAQKSQLMNRARQRMRPRLHAWVATLTTAITQLERWPIKSA